MKRIMSLVVILLILLSTFTGCVKKQMKVDVSKDKGDIISYSSKGNNFFAYQGVIKVSVADVENISKISVTTKNYTGKENSLLTIHKADSSSFAYEDVKYIKAQMEKGDKFDTLDFQGDEVQNNKQNSMELNKDHDGPTTYIQIHYLLLDVPASADNEETIGTGVFQVKLIDTNNKIIDDNEVQVEIP